MTRLINYIFAIVWFLLILGSLQLSHLKLPSISFCFEEHCFPTDTGALVSIHTFWLMLFVPGTIIVAKASKFGRVKSIWMYLGGFALVGWAVTFLPGFSSYASKDLSLAFKHIAFVTLTNTDFPFVHFAIASVAALVTAMLLGKKVCCQKITPTSVLEQSAASEMEEFSQPTT